MVFFQCTIHTNSVCSVHYSYKWCLFNIPFLRQRFLTVILSLVVATDSHFMPWPSMKGLCHAFRSRSLLCSFVLLSLLDVVFFFYQAWGWIVSSRPSCLELYFPSPSPLTMNQESSSSSYPFVYIEDYFLTSFLCLLLGVGEWRVGPSMATTKAEFRGICWAVLASSWRRSNHVLICASA